MSDALFASYAEVLSLCQSLRDDLEAILDPETGFAPRLRRVCRDQLAEYEQSFSNGGLTREEIDVLKLEENTWALLQAIMPVRKLEPIAQPTARELLSQNPYTPPSSLAQAIMDSSLLLKELVVVREWLHDTAPPPSPSDATTGYWKFTKHSLLQAIRTAGGSRDGLVKEMDPDVVNKGDGRALASDDANSEKGLGYALYTCIRAGRVDEAIELCRKAHQPWRASSIRGAQVFQWDAMASTDAAELDDSEDSDSWKGNRRRRLWKSTYTRAALNPSIPHIDRVLFAALAPSPQTSTILKSVSRTWEDHLWAQLSIVCEEKQCMEMALLANRSFWEGGDSATNQPDNHASDINREEEEGEWEREVVSTLEGLKSISVVEGLPADHAFHVSQLHIILDRTSALLDIFADGLRDDIPTPPLATQTILEAYIRILESAGQRELIALYAGALGDNAIERYALFLTSLELGADISERRLALTRGTEHGLDLDRVAVATAERTIEKAFEVLPPLTGPLPSVIAMQPPLSEPELLLLRSIEWTTFSNATFNTALEQTNVILRYFLAAGRVSAAQQLLSVLPPDLASISEPEEWATEYLHYRQFFVVWEALHQVVECESLESPQMNRESRNSWLKEYTSLVETAHEKIMKLLTSEWLVSDVDVAVADRRRRELVRIRQVYIPELIIRLHHALFSSRHKLPQNLKLVFKLATVVADSRYKLYEDFVGDGGRPLNFDYLQHPVSEVEQLQSSTLGNTSPRAEYDFSSPKAGPSKPSGSGLKLIIPPLKGGKVVKNSKSKNRKPDGNVPEEKIPKPVKLKPLKDVLTKLISQIKKKDDYAFFLKPVDASAIPGYSEMITNPMDFGTMTVKVSKGRYRNLDEFTADLKLVTQNAMRFNPPGTIYHTEAQRIESWSLDHIERMAPSVIQHQTDWNLDVEDEVESQQVNIDEDDETNFNVPSTPMDVDDISKAGRSPSVSSQPPSNLTRRTLRAPILKKSTASTTTALSESLDSEGRLPGSKDGLGAFPPQSDWAETMLMLKLKGKKYKTKKERLRVVKEGPPYAPDGSLDYSQMEDPFTVLSTFVPEARSRPRLLPLYPPAVSSNVSHQYPAPTTLPLGHFDVDGVSLSTKQPLAKYKHWHLTRTSQNRSRKDKDDPDDTSNELPEWQAPREPHALDFGSMAILSSEIAKELRQRCSLVSTNLDTAPGDSTYFSDVHAREADVYVRDIVYGGSDGFAYATSLAAFTIHQDQIKNGDIPISSSSCPDSNSDDGGGLGASLADWATQHILDPMTDGRHSLLRQTALHLHSLIQGADAPVVNMDTDSDGESNEPRVRSLGDQVALSVYTYPLAHQALSTLRQIYATNIDLGCLIRDPSEFAKSEDEWIGNAIKTQLASQAGHQDSPGTVDEDPKLLTQAFNHAADLICQTHKEILDGKSSNKHPFAEPSLVDGESTVPALVSTSPGAALLNSNRSYVSVRKSLPPQPSPQLASTLKAGARQYYCAVE
ncbi:hypothetical protein ONZ45_g15800 [Pleurotus djamor]|nr:hypothetical protein ONZ45_g15800 [Pleurotus djamor]